MIKTTYKKQPLIPKLQNITANIEINQPLSCRQQKQTYISFVQPSLRSARQKENNYKLSKTPTKLDYSSLNVSKNIRSQNNSQIQSSQSILNALNQNIKLRHQMQTYQNHSNYKSNNVTPTKIEQLDEQAKLEKQQTQEIYQQIIKQRQISMRNNSQSKNSYCSNHKDKKAKFYKLQQNNEKEYLCSHCAIQEAYDFHGHIYDCKSNQAIPKKVKQNQWIINCQTPICPEQNQKLSQLKEFLNLAKQLYESAKLRQDYQNKFNIQEILEEIENISSDIINNAQNIVNNVESKSFQMILQNYVQRLQQFDILINKQNNIKKLPTKQVLISFQNKDSFLNPDQLQSTDSLMLRQSETQHFLEDYNDTTIYAPNF